MIPRYIEATEAIRVLSEYYHHRTDAQRYVLAEAISRVPTADVVEVKHGYFIGTEFDGYADGYPVFYEWKCSECGCIFEDEEPTYNYCPQCGAKMDGEEADHAQLD